MKGDMEQQNKRQLRSHGVIVCHIELIDLQYCIFCFSMVMLIQHNYGDNGAGLSPLLCLLPGQYVAQ